MTTVNQFSKNDIKGGNVRKVDSIQSQVPSVNSYTKDSIKGTDYTDIFLDFESDNVIVDRSINPNNIPEGMVNSSRSADGFVIFYGDKGKVLRVIDKDGNIFADYSYEDNGVKITYQDRVEYRKNNIITNVDYNDGSRDVYSYDKGIIKTIETFDKDGKLIATTENENNHYKSVNRSNGEETQIFYNENNEMKGMIDTSSDESKTFTISNQGKALFSRDEMEYIKGVGKPLDNGSKHGEYKRNS